MSNPLYTNDFFITIRSGSRRSAEIVVPIILPLIKPKSVVDIGCGDGTWLSVFRDLGVNDITGLDGDYVDLRLLQIQREQFRPTNLSVPFTLPRRFELAMSLEVAEHLPPESAKGFVDDLVRLAPVVLFSAAIPLQGGVHHLNEQWPDYWAELFKAHNYLPVDCIRGRIWKNDQVEYWYIQNILIFASADYIRQNPALLREHEKTNIGQLSLVHPRRFVQAFEPGVREAFNLLVKAGTDKVRREIRKLKPNRPG
jgi:SAM-dependent methyltransferase